MLKDGRCRGESQWEVKWGMQGWSCQWEQRSCTVEQALLHWVTQHTPDWRVLLRDRATDPFQYPAPEMCYSLYLLSIFPGDRSNRELTLDCKSSIWKENFRNRFFFMIWWFLHAYLCSSLSHFKSETHHLEHSYTLAWQLISAKRVMLFKEQCESCVVNLGQIQAHQTVKEVS